VKDFADDTSEAKERAPKSPLMSVWRRRLGDACISYYGEFVEKANPGPNKARAVSGGYGGSVPLVELCDGELKTCWC